MSGLIFMCGLYAGVALYSVHYLMYSDFNLKDTGIVCGTLLVIAIALIKYSIELGGM